MPDPLAPRQESLRSSTVIILKKMQGSVWRETGRTGVCPTPEWLYSSYGEGEYELRLKSGNRVLCMVGVDTGPASTSDQKREPANGDTGGRDSLGRQDNGSRRSGMDFQLHRRVLRPE